MTDVTWTCRCGAVEMRISGGQGDRLVCYCKDCQGFARHLGADGSLDDAGGSDLYNTVPDRLEMVKGPGHLQALRMTPKGPIRWYAACCGTPLANTAPRRGLPFATMILHPGLAADPLGPVRFRVGIEGARGPVPKASGVGGFIRRAMARALVARLAGRHVRTPFFDAAGDPVAAPRLLTAAERRAALP